MYSQTANNTKKDVAKTEVAIVLDIATIMNELQRKRIAIMFQPHAEMYRVIMISLSILILQPLLQPQLLHP